MKSKNSSPSRHLNPNEQTSNQQDARNTSPRHSQSRTPTLHAPNAASERRGTQCSISLLDNLENQISSNRAGSLPFEALSNLLQNQLHYDNDDDNVGGANAEVYRVRQFHTTNKGAVINRGDSFKRSFKKSTQSISSSSNKNKKDHSPAAYLESKTLNLPEYQDDYLNRSKHGVSETSFIEAKTNGADSMTNAGNGSELTRSSKQATASALSMQVVTYMVYVMGASTVGKNALIKQFKTSEYRGTYDISAHFSQGRPQLLLICVGTHHEKLRY